MRWVRGWLEHPLARGRDLDDPSTTALRQEIIADKPFLQAIYRDWYREMSRYIDPGGLPIVEIGAGAGISREVFPRLVRTDVLSVPGLDAVMDGCRMALRRESIGAIVMTNVFHHMPDPSGFLKEAERCLVAGGMLVMVEPWVTRWSLFVYRTFHHEPIDPGGGWTPGAGGPLTAANGALPWIVFHRDRAAFQQRHPGLELVRAKPMMPFRYLVSGGVSHRSLVPGWSTPAWRAVEGAMQPFASQLGMFALIVLRKRAAISRC